MVIELRVVQFWSEIILVISNRTRAARSFDFEITRMISDQIALHSVQLPLYIVFDNKTLISLTQVRVHKIDIDDFSRKESSTRNLHSAALKSIFS